MGALAYCEGRESPQNRAWTAFEFTHHFERITKIRFYNKKKLPLGGALVVLLNLALNAKLTGEAGVQTKEPDLPEQA